MQAFVVSSPERAAALQFVLGPEVWKVLYPGCATIGFRFHTIVMALDYGDLRFESVAYTDMVMDWIETLKTRVVPNGAYWVWLT